MPTRPNCRHTWNARKPKADPVDRLLSDLTEAELRAHYHATAPLEDVRFFTRGRYLSPAVRSGADALLSAVEHQRIPRAEVYRQLTALQNQWRREDYWGSVIRPAERLERRKAKARSRMTCRAYEVAA